MKKSLAIACAALMLLTGCGSSGGSKVSEVPTTGAGDVIVKNEKDGLDGREWKEYFVVTREDGVELPFEVDLVTTILSDDADSVIEYSNEYESNENRRKVVEYLLPDCKLFPSGQDYMTKGEIQEIIDKMENILVTYDWDNREPGIVSKESHQDEINDYKRLLQTAPDSIDEVTEIVDGSYSAKRSERQIASVTFHNYRVYSEDRYFRYSNMEEKHENSSKPRQRFEIEKEQEIANGILSVLGAEQVEIIPDPNTNGEADYIDNNKGYILVYPSIRNVYMNNHYISIWYCSHEGENYLDQFIMTPLIITNKKEHVSLLSFEEAVNAIKSNLDKGAFYKYAQSNIVNKMELGLYPVETEDGGAYVPAWIINDGLLVINAIDGTFIDAIDKK